MSQNNFLLALMILIAIAINIFKFWGNWFHLGVTLGLQILMVNTINSYFKNKSMSLGMVSLAPDSESIGRKIFFTAAAIVYLLLFFL